jgi:hypothetical protein
MVCFRLDDWGNFNDSSDRNDQGLLEGFAMEAMPSVAPSLTLWITIGAAQ